MGQLAILHLGQAATNGPPTAPWSLVPGGGLIVLLLPATAAILHGSICPCLSCLATMAPRMPVQQHSVPTPRPTQLRQ